MKILTAFPLVFWATLSPLFGQFSDALLRDESLWSDGKAEYLFFDAVEMRYGKPRKSEVRQFLVRESFLPKTPVKADDWRTPGAYPVVKLNQILRVPVGVYEYDQMHSAFWNASTGALEKWSLASIDSCGNTYKEARIREGRLEYEARTYWEGMARVNREIQPPAGALFYDELPFKLRLLDWDRTATFTAPLSPSVIHSKADRLKFELARFSISATANEKRVTMEHSGGVDEFVFDPAAPFRLKSWKKADGGSLTAKGGGRIDYWNKNQPGDEAWIDENVSR